MRKRVQLATMAALIAGAAGAWAADANGALGDIVARLANADPRVKSDALRDLEQLCLNATKEGAKTQRIQLAKDLAEQAGKDLPVDTRVLLINQFGTLGGDGAGMEVTRFIDDKEPVIRDAALAALTKNSSDEAGIFLAERLKNEKGRGAAVYLKALGYRGRSGAETVIAEKLDGPASDAASAALGAIASVDAAKALQGFLAQAGQNKAAEKNAAAEALLTCAEKLLAKAPGDAAAAARAGTLSIAEVVKIFESLDVDGQPKLIRQQAFRGILLAQLKPESAEYLFVDGKLIVNPEHIRSLGEKVLHAFAGNSAELRRVAESTLMEQRLKDGDAMARATIEWLAPKQSELPPAGQISLMHLAAAFRAAGYSPAVTAALRSDNGDVKKAAIDASGVLCGKEAAVPLIAIAATDSSNQAAARQSLSMLQDPQTDKAIIEQFTREETAYRIEAIKALASRGGSGTFDAALSLAENDKEVSVRAAAMEAAGNLGQGGDAAKVLARLSVAPSGVDREAAESAARMLLPKLTEPAERAKALNTVLGKSSGENRLAIIRLLGRTGEPEALTAIRTYLKDADAATRDAAVRALSDWPTPEVMPDLLELAKNGEKDAHKVLAARGYLRLVGANVSRPPAETAAMCAAILPVVRPEEKRVLIACLGDAPCSESFALVTPMIDEPAVSREAMPAAAKIARSEARRNPDAVIAAMKKVLATMPTNSDAHRDAEAANAEAERVKARGGR